jgi:iron complex outermembrane receptor protein
MSNGTLNFHFKNAGAAVCRLSGAAMLLASPAAALAQSAVTLPPVAVDTVAPAPGLTEPLGGATLAGEALASKRPGSADAAALLRDLPGVGLYSGGGLSSLPVIHGLADDRTQTRINGMALTSACPNHMNSPLATIDPSRVARVEVTTALTPVSKGGDSIGGTIAMDSAPPAFAAPGEKLHVEGEVSGFYRSVNRAIGAAGRASVADQHYALGYAGSTTRASNYRAGGDGPTVKSSAFDNSDHTVTFATQQDNHLLTLEGGITLVPYEGFPNQRMDLTRNFSRFVNGHYQGDFGWGSLDARVFWQDTDHKMDFLADKYAGMGMPMFTAATDLGYSLKAELPLKTRDTLRLGNELHRFTLNDWWPPTSSGANGSMSPNTFVNIKDGERSRIGSFVEWEAKWDPQWTTLLGARNDVVLMDTGAVSPYSWTDVTRNMMTGATTALNYRRDANAFNARSHARTDINFDLTGLVRYEPDRISRYEAGYSRKTRSPNLYERYSWSTGAMASNMVNWVGDGNGYVGNLDLKPEVAHTASISAGFHDPDQTLWEVKLSPYYSYVQDYIGVDRLQTYLSGGKPTGFVQLQFANHDAQLYGADLSGHARLWEDESLGRFELAGTLGWVHGETLNSGASNGIYHLMPIHGRLSLGHRLEGWRNALELELVGGKDAVDNVRNEPRTGGYSLVNLRTGYEWQSLRVDFAVENLMNTRYDLPLGGIDYADYKAAGNALPGPGRSFVIGSTLKF